MGKRGPLPKSHALKMLSGTVPLTGDALETFNEPFDPPKIPEHFTKDEQKIWNETIKLLELKKMVENIDHGVLAAYCCSYVKWQNAELAIQLQKANTFQGLVTVDKKGMVKGVNPLFIVSRKAMEDMVNYAGQLGMTPAARIRIKVISKDDKKNPFLEIKASGHRSMK